MTQLIRECEIPANPNDFPENFDPNDPSSGFSLLCLSNLHSAAAHRIPFCTSCGCNCSPASAGSSIPMKRRSPDSTLGPKPKKLFLDQGDESQSLAGFSQIPVPIDALTPSPTQTQPRTQVESYPVLRRCISDPTNPPQSPPENVPTGAGANPATPLSSGAKGSASGSALPPLPPTLRRSVSDPTPSPAKTFSRTASSSEIGVDFMKEESPSCKKLRKIKDRMREINQLWDEAMREEEAEEVGGTEENTNKAKEEAEVELEEAVSVERTGECLIIHFKCPCSKGYQILLSGKNCYYKLI